MPPMPTHLVFDLIHDDGAFASEAAVIGATSRLIYADASMGLYRSRIDGQFHQPLGAHYQRTAKNFYIFYFI